jgi:parallel beta-helix repeat protein
MQLFFLTVLNAQNITVVTPPNGTYQIAPEIIKNVVQQNFQQLKLKNNQVKIFYTKDSGKFIIAKVSSFIYKVSFLLIKYDGNSIIVEDSNFVPHTADFMLYTQNHQLQKTLTTYDFLFDTPCYDIPTAVNAVNNVSTYATNQNYTVNTLIGSSATLSNIENAITNDNIIAMGNIGHGNDEGILLYDGFLDYTWFASQDLSNKIFFFNSCQVFNDPLKSAILDDGNARTFTGGIVDLPIGSSEYVFQDFWDYTLNSGWHMNDALTQGMSNRGLTNYYSIGGDVGIMNLTTSGTLRGNEIWSGNITVTGNVTVPSGITLTINSGANLTFNNSASLTINGTLYSVGTLSSPITFNFTSPNSTTENGIKLNSGSSGTINYCKIQNAYRGIYENGVSVNITNSAINNCTNGLYLYNSSPTINSCNIHDNIMGIYLVNSSPYLYNNYIRNNTSVGIDCLSSSSPYFGSGSTHGKNDITGNNNGVMCYDNSSPRLGNTSDGGYNNLGNNSASNVYCFSTIGVFAINNYWGTGGYKIYGTGSVAYLPTQPQENVPTPPLSKTGDEYYASLSSDIPLLSDFEKAEQLILEKNLDQAREACLNLINNYPDYSISYNALNLLKETYAADDIAGKKNIYKSLFNSKEKKDIYAMAGLILAEIDKENRLKQINEVMNNYAGESVVELALFNKFVYYNFELNDKENSRTVSKELDGLFSLSQGAIEAHRILGDKEYYNINADHGKNLQKTSIQTPKEYALYANYPNPFNPTTTINFQIPEDGFVTLKVYDILGREVASLVNADKKAGYYSCDFDASKLSSGVYIYKITANNFVQSKKMLMIK